MLLKTPEFWYKKHIGFCAIILWPLSVLYYMGHLCHQIFTPKPKSANPIPIICIGNITAGGSGKTPTAIMVMQFLKDLGLFSNPAFLSRGYGRKTRHNLRASPNHHITDIGDEALMLVQYAPTYVAKNRHDGMKMAAHDGVGILLLDDGYQNPSFRADKYICVVNGYDGFGNECLLPAGPLRQPAHIGLRKADAVIYIHDPRGQNLSPDAPIFAKKHVIECRLHVDDNDNPKDMEYIAFTGIARPEKFYATLKNEGYHLAHKKSFPDHHHYNDSDLYQLDLLTKGSLTKFMTTEKDYVRLPAHFQANTHQLKIKLIPENIKDLISFLRHIGKSA